MYSYRWKLQMNARKKDSYKLNIYIVHLSLFTINCNLLCYMISVCGCSLTFIMFFQSSSLLRILWRLIRALLNTVLLFLYFIFIGLTILRCVIITVFTIFCGCLLLLNKEIINYRSGNKVYERLGHFRNRLGVLSFFIIFLNKNTRVYFLFFKYRWGTFNSV